MTEIFQIMPQLLKIRGDENLPEGRETTRVKTYKSIFTLKFYDLFSFARNQQKTMDPSFNAAVLL